ncbi:MAG: Spy/CpxP family protein refolding chaperone [Alcanivorax sp.]|jgi:Spy/CpxP family protein refolding chaperone
MKIASRFLTCLLVCWIPLAAAQNSANADTDNRDVLRMGLYPPDILMRQQQSLNISGEQRTAIAELVREFQGDVTELQWAMPNEQQKLRKMLTEDSIDAKPALEQAAKVLEMETTFKMAHFDMLIAIKNELTEEQIRTLNTAIRRRLPQLDKNI